MDCDSVLEGVSSWHVLLRGRASETLCSAEEAGHEKTASRVQKTCPGWGNPQTQSTGP